MLKSIHIENIALIRKLDIEFAGSFCAFTGETGAGKSIIIDSISLICGARGSKELIRNGETSALVEAMFSELSEQCINRCSLLGVEPDEDGFLYISRTLNSDGKSTARINSRPVPVSLLRDISPYLINIHGQHDNQELLVRDSHRIVLDRFAENTALADEYKAEFLEYCRIKKEYDSIKIDDSQKQRQIEMLTYQIKEISSLKLKPGEEEELLSERKRIANIEKISRNSQIVYESLYGNSGSISACESIDRAIDALTQLSDMTDGVEEHIETLTSYRSVIMDIAETVSELGEFSGDDPTAALDRIENRLDDIAKAKRKYGSDINEVLEYYDKACKELDLLQNTDKNCEILMKKLKEEAEKVKTSAKKLSDSRKKAAEVLKTRIEEEFGFLEMSKTAFMTKFEEKPYSKDGIDDIEFMISTNSGEGFSPLCKTASGGELSRIMLAIKNVIAKKDGIDTLIFDEVDTGISGKTSRKIGVKLKEISEYSQVLCVTHSAQIASLANVHFLVSKHEENGRTETSVKALDKEQRIEETARILSGINITDNARKTAHELIYGN